MSDLGKILGYTSVTSPITGGLNSSGTVTIGAPAPNGGQVVNLNSSDTSVATVPSSVTVAPGQTQSPSFTITTYVVSGQKTVSIGGTYGGNFLNSATLTVNVP